MIVSAVHFEDLELSRGDPSGGGRSKVGDAVRRDIDRDTLDAPVRGPTEPLRDPDDELSLARRNVEDSRFRREIEQLDEFVDLPDTRGVADDMIAVRDVVELPRVHQVPPTHVLAPHRPHCTNGEVSRSPVRQLQASEGRPWRPSLVAADGRANRPGPTWQP